MNILAEKILIITTEYIGPASLRFLERQASRHLNGIEFPLVERKHLPELIKWIKVAGGLLVGDAKAKELGDKIEKL